MSIAVPRIAVLFRTGVDWRSDQIRTARIGRNAFSMSATEEFQTDSSCNNRVEGSDPIKPWEVDTTEDLESLLSNEALTDESCFLVGREVC